MRRSAIVLFAAAFGGGMLGVQGNARALGPVDLEVAAKAGAGGAPFSNQPNPLGFGLGARAGLVFLGWYGGLSLMYYFGESGNVGSVPASDKAVLYGVEAGYGLNVLGLLTLRAQLGAGSFNVNYTGGMEGQVGFSNLYLEPGVTALLTFGMLFVGADLNLLVLPGITNPAYPTAPASWATALTAHGQVGVKF